MTKPEHWWKKWALQQGEGIEIRDFGSFTVRDYKAYEGRNPRTGGTVHFKPKRSCERGHSGVSRAQLQHRRNC
ncbi:MAG TPA: HU family DNA-binding protein [Polyangia bacterium]